MQTINLFQGDSYLLDLSFKAEDGTPTNLTNDTIYLTVKSNVADPDTQALMQQTNTTHILPLEGLSSVQMNSAQTVVFPRKAYFDIVWIHRIGGSTDEYIANVTTLASGEVNTQLAVTQHKA